MRVTSLVALVLVVGAAAYFIFLTPDWAKEMYLKATGYGPAATPTECVDKFIKAVKARDLKTAARYCSGDYAEQLKRAAEANSELGPVLDDLMAFMKNKGLATDKSVTFLHFVDAFPPNIKVKGAPKEKGDAAVALIEIENIWPGNMTNLLDLANELQSVDRRMYNRVLMPVTIYTAGSVELAKDGDSWKLKVPMPQIQAEAVTFYINNYKAYHTGLHDFMKDVNNGRYASKQDFEKELMSVLHKAKG